MIDCKNLDIWYEAENYYNLIKRRDFKMTTIQRFTEIVNAIAAEQDTVNRGNKIKSVWSALQIYIEQHSDGTMTEREELYDWLNVDFEADCNGRLIDEITDIANEVYDSVYRTRIFSSIITTEEAWEIVRVLQDITHISWPAYYDKRDYAEMVEDTLKTCKELYETLKRRTRARDEEIIDRIVRGGYHDDVKGN